MMNNARLGGILLLIFCLTYAWLSQSIRLLPFQMNTAFHARTMPEFLAVLGIVLSIAIILFPGSRERVDWRALNWPLGIAFLILMSAYGFTVRPLGFILSTSLFLIIGFRLLGERSPIRLLAVSVPLVVAFWALMNFGLDVFIEPLPWILRG